MPGVVLAPTTAQARATVVARREAGDGRIEIRFSDGSIYTGTARGTVPQGHGEYRSDAFRYEGDFDRGRKQGLGIYEWKSGDRYEGSATEEGKLFLQIVASPWNNSSAGNYRVRIQTDNVALTAR